MFSHSKESLKLTLPWPPSVNHYKKVGRLVTTTSGKLYQQRVNTNETQAFYYETYIRTKQQLAREGFKFVIGETIPLGVDVWLHPPNEKRYDIDNRLKVLLDGLVRAKIIIDDSLINRLLVQKMGMIPNGQVIVNIYPLQEGVEQCT